MPNPSEFLRPCPSASSRSLEGWIVRECGVSLAALVAQHRSAGLRGLMGHFPEASPTDLLRALQFARTLPEVTNVPNARASTLAARSPSALSL